MTLRYHYQDRVVVGLSTAVHHPAVVDLAAGTARRRALPLCVYAEDSRAAVEAVRRVRSGWPDLAVTAHRVPGDLAARLVAESARAATVVVGRDTAATVARSTYHTVAAHAHSPVLVVPEDADPLLEGVVLVGLDLRGTDEPAIAFAFAEADVRRTTLVAMHVWAGAPPNDLSPVDPYRYDEAVARDTVDRLLAESLAGWMGKYPDVHVYRRPHQGADPARALLAAGRQAELVVLGSNRHGPRSSHLIGPVAHHVLEHAVRPVAVVHVATPPAGG